MPMEVQGALIEMNVAKVLSPDAQTLMSLSIVFFAMFVTAFVVNIAVNKNVRIAAALSILIALSVTGFCIGINTPRVRQIEYCAVGPVSIEEISERFDIVEINGKKIVVRERRSADEQPDQTAG